MDVASLVSLPITLPEGGGGNATAEELVQLARAVRASVQEKFGITLEPEVNLVGLAL